MAINLAFGKLDVNQAFRCQGNRRKAIDSATSWSGGTRPPMTMERQ
jgi:hypothetical protein